MPLFDILFKDGVSEHHADREIVTIKPGGSLWVVAEIPIGYACCALDLDEALSADAMENMSQFRIDSKENPTALVRV